MLPQEIRSDFFQSRNFKLNVEKRPLPVAGKDVLQLRQRRQLPATCLCDLDSAKLRIMTDYGPSISRAPHVKLKTVAAVGQRLIE